MKFISIRYFLILTLFTGCLNHTALIDIKSNLSNVKKHPNLSEALLQIADQSYFDQFSELINILESQNYTLTSTGRLHFIHKNNPNLVKALILQSKSTINKFNDITNIKSQAVNQKPIITFIIEDPIWNSFFSGEGLLHKKIPLLFIKNDFNWCINSTFSHELTHFLLRNTFKTNNIPLWLDEGIASYMENEFCRNQTYSDIKIFKNGAIDQTRFIPLISLFEMTHLPKNLQFFYAESYFFLKFLIKDVYKKRFKDFLKEYLESSESGHKNLKVYCEKYCEKDIISNDLERSFIDYLALQKLDLPSNKSSLLEIEKVAIDFGRQEQNKELFHSFSIKNVSNKILFIKINLLYSNYLSTDENAYVLFPKESRDIRVKLSTANMIGKFLGEIYLLISSEAQVSKKIIDVMAYIE